MLGQTTTAAPARARLAPALACASVVTLATLAAGGSAAAQTGGEALPGGRALIDRYVQAIGGADRLREIESVRTTGSVTITTMGMAATMETFQMRPDRSYSRVSVEGIGEIRRGFDGAVGWSINPMEGPRLLEGAELADARDNAAFAAMTRDTSVIASAETLDKSEMGGQACYRVKLVWKSGRESTDCYAVDTGLLVASTMTVTTQMGAVPATSFFGQYRDFGGVLMASVVRQQVMMLEQTLTVDSVEFNSVDTAVFELPPEIRTLRGSRSGPS
jgi:hypothetical protein